MTKHRDLSDRSGLRRSSRFSRPLPSIVAWLVASMVSLPAAAPTNSVLALPTPPLPLPLPDAGFSVLRIFGALTIVIALFLGAVWVFRNWRQLSGQRLRPQQLEVLETRSLGGRHALHVVGYQGQRILIASSPNGVSLVSHLPADDPRPAADAVPTSPNVVAGPGSGNFVEALQQAIQRKP